MEIKTTQKGANVFFSMKGRLDTLTSPRLQEAFSGIFSEAATIELDFSGVDYVSSAGLRVLLMAEKNVKAAGKTMKLKNVSDEIMEVFEVTGFTGILNIE